MRDGFRRKGPSDQPATVGNPITTRCVYQKAYAPVVFLICNVRGDIGMNEITISKKHLFIWLLVVILLASIGFGIYAFRRFMPGQEAAPQPVTAASLTTPDDDQLAQAAAVAGAQAFYTVDYQKGKQAWLDQLCAVSTSTGCAIDQNVFVPALWPQLEAAKTSTTVQLSAQEKVIDQINPLGDVPRRLWRLENPAFCALAGSRAAPDQFPGVGVGDA